MGVSILLTLLIANMMAGIREVIDLVARVLPEEEGQHSTSIGDALRRYLVRKASSFTPAFIRNIKTDATERWYGPTAKASCQGRCQSTFRSF